MLLIDVLKKRKRKKELDNDSIRNFILGTVNQIVEEEFDKRFNKLTKGIEDKATRKTDLVLSNLKDGYSPIKGEDYFDGEKGEQGDKGDKGDSPTKTFLKGLVKPLIPKPIKGDKGDSIKGDKGDDGSPDKPKDIVKKLHTLENVLDVKVLKGLKPILKSIQESMRAVSKGGGGGMGLPVHEQFDGDGSTTEFTLSYNVAASGNAVMACRYQGQVQHLGDQYTISGKTLTFTFTPANGTKIEITYIRT